MNIAISTRIPAGKTERKQKKSKLKTEQVRFCGPAGGW